MFVLRYFDREVVLSYLDEFYILAVSFVFP